MPIAVQMYTLREETEKDFVGTLRRVAEIGYRGVEFAGFGGLSAREVKKLLAELNLTPAGAHIGLDAIERDPGGVFDYQLAIGNPYVVIPYLPAPETLDGWAELASRLNAVGEQCRRNDLQLCYHNHAHEFVQIDGKYGLDLLYQLTDARLVKAEFDCYWIQKAGQHPAAYLRRYAGRTPLLHVKDMTPDGDFAEFGAGILPWNEILPAARTAGTQWYIVEQDVCQRPCLESVAISFGNLEAALGK